MSVSVPDEHDFTESDREVRLFRKWWNIPFGMCVCGCVMQKKNQLPPHNTLPDKLHLYYVFNFTNHPFNSTSASLHLSIAFAFVSIFCMGATRFVRFVFFFFFPLLLTPSFDRTFIWFNRIDTSAARSFWSSAAHRADNHFIWIHTLFFFFFLNILLSIFRVDTSFGFSCVPLSVCLWGVRTRAKEFFKSGQKCS